MFDWLTARKAKFPQSVIEAAQKCQRETGIPACATLAQWALESNYGKALSGLNNPFGIKWNKRMPYGYKLCKTWEWVAGRGVIYIDAPFVSFPSIEEAFRYKGYLMSRPDGYYADELREYKQHKDWKRYLRDIANTDSDGPGYATDPQYAAKLINIIDTYRLAGYNLPGT